MSSQSAKVLRHDEPPLQPPRRIPRHGIPVGHQHKRLVKHLLRRFPPLAEPDLAHRGDDDAHLAPALLVLVALVDIVGGAVLERRVDDVGVERLDLVQHILALGLEELGVLRRRGDDGAVDGDVGRDVVARGRVDVEGVELGAAVDCLVVAARKVLGSCFRVKVSDWESAVCWYRC